MTGFYSAYYANGGNKTRKPKELIDKLYAKPHANTDGARDIDRIKSLYGDNQ